MADQIYYSVFTKQGLALLTEAIQNGTKLGITAMAFGDGGGSLPVPNENFTSLINEVHRTQLNSIAPDPNNANWLRAEAIIASAIGGFNIRELGLYAGDVLVAYSNYPATYKPNPADGTARIMTFRMILQIDNVANFELVIDPDVVLATIQYVKDQIITTQKIDAKDFFVGTFFDTDDRICIRLAKSSTPSNFQFLHSEYLRTTANTLRNDFKVNGRDPSLIFFKGYWYIARTSADGDIGDKDFTIFRSNNLSDWEVFGCNLGSTPLRAKDASVINGQAGYQIGISWAPEFFIDNGKLYVLISCHIGNNVIDIDGNAAHNLAVFISECTNIESLTFTFPKPLIADRSVSRIDAHIIKKQNTYYLSVKDDNNKIIEIYKSQNLDKNYVLHSKYSTIRIEGQNIVWSNVDKKFYMYGDRWENSGRLYGMYYSIASTDLVTFEEPVLISNAKNPMRHGSILNLYNLDDSANAIQSFNKNAALLSFNESKNSKTYGGFNTGACIELSIDDLNFKPVDDAIYIVTGDKSVVLTVNSNDAKDFYVIAATALDNAGITLKGNFIDDVIKIGYGLTGDQIIKFTYHKFFNKYLPSSTTSSSFDKFLKKNNKWTGSQILGYLRSEVIASGEWIDVGPTITETDHRRIGFFYNDEVVASIDTANNDMIIFAQNAIKMRANIQAYTDNTYTIGSASLRFSTVYASTGTINTSDRNYKEQFRSINNSERDAAIEIKANIQFYKFKDAVERKKNGARWHVGVVAQDVVDIMTKHGLDWRCYGFICYDEWEAQEKRTSLDLDGNEIEISPEIKAGSRYAIRYDELAMFLVAMV